MTNVFGSRFRQLRLNAGMTQDTLAKKLHVARCTVAGYETRDRLPDADMLCDIADCFGVSVDYLLGRTTRKKTPK